MSTSLLDRRKDAPHGWSAVRQARDGGARVAAIVTLSCGQAGKCAENTMRRAEHAATDGADKFLWAAAVDAEADPMMSRSGPSKSLVPM